MIWTNMSILDNHDTIWYNCSKEVLSKIESQTTAFFRACDQKLEVFPLVGDHLKVSKSRKQIMMSKKRTKLSSGYYPECVLFVFWKNPGLHNLLSRFTDLYNPTSANFAVFF